MCRKIMCSTAQESVLEWRLVWSTCINGNRGISAAWAALNICCHYVCVCEAEVCAADGS